MFDWIKVEIADFIDILRPMKLSEETASEFKEKLIHENSKRLLLMLMLVLLSQIFLLVYEGLFSSADASDLVWVRVTIMGVSLLFALLIRIGQRLSRDQSWGASFSGAVIFLILVSSLASACYFTSYMFEEGIYSFSPLILVLVVISLTCFRNPYYSGLILIAIFLVLTVFLHTSVMDISVWQGEFMVNCVIVILIYFGNILSYQRHLIIFQHEKSLQKLSQTDELTGLLNRSEVYRQIELLMRLASRYGTTFSLAILDIDHFKRVNDTYGHVKGDEVLCRFAESISKRLRSADTFGRWGGEEFMIAAPNCDLESAFRMVERLRADMQDVDYAEVGQITFSAGICAYSGELSVTDLVRRADRALYKAKAEGRNCSKVG